VTVQYITRAEQLAEQAAREAAEAREGEAGLGEAAQAITYDGACSGTALWIYDKTTGYGNQICFFGTGTANLSNYIRYVCSSWTCYKGNWASAVRSYWPGNEGGYFLMANGGIVGREYFRIWGPFTNAGYYAQNASVVALNCIPGSQACSDGNVCNGVETCGNDGFCVAGTAAPSGSSCSDGQACNGHETCNGSGSCVAGAACTSCHGGVCQLDPGDACVPGDPASECVGGRCGFFDHRCHLGCSCDLYSNECEPSPGPPPAEYSAVNMTLTPEDTDSYEDLWCGAANAPCVSNSDCCYSYRCVIPQASSIGLCDDEGPGHLETCK
jgi:hypothetical protein